MKRVAQCAALVFPCFFLLLVLQAQINNRDFSFYALIQRLQSYTFPNPYDSFRQAGEKIDILNSIAFVNFNNPWSDVSWWNIVDVVKAIGNTVSMIANVITYLVKLVYYGVTAVATFIGTMLADILAFFLAIFGWLF